MSIAKDLNLLVLLRYEGAKRFNYHKALSTD